MVDVFVDDHYAKSFMANTAVFQPQNDARKSTYGHRKTRGQHGSWPRHAKSAAQLNERQAGSLVGDQPAHNEALPSA